MDDGCLRATVRAALALAALGAIGVLSACSEDPDEVPVPYDAAPLPGTHARAAPRPTNRQRH
jgi:hypothetical protein